MSARLDEAYLIWLYRQVGNSRVKDSSRTYWSLLRQLFRTEFVWLVANDDNRVEDGRELRYEFLNQRGIDNADPEWLDQSCSILEMIIGLSRRLSFEAEGEPRDWFWVMLNNLGIADFTDRYFDGKCKEQVEDILDALNYRSYSPRGDGGLFPLKNPKRDQRHVEIWYQMAQFLLESET